MATLRRLARGIDRLNDRIGVTIRWAVLLMVLLGATVTLLRYASRGLGLTLNLTPYTEAQWYLFSTVFLLGAAYALRRDAHVRVDVVYERLSRRARSWIDLIGTLVFLVPFSILMLVVSWPAVRNSWQVRETSPDPGGLARYPIKALILVSFALLLLQAVSQAVALIDTLRSDAAAEEPPEAEPEVHV